MFWIRRLSLCVVVGCVFLLFGSFFYLPIAFSHKFCRINGGFFVSGLSNP